MNFLLDESYIRPKFIQLNVGSITYLISEISYLMIIMTRKVSIGFMLLICMQGFHSLEEYAGRLWEVFLPAKILCGLVSPDLEFGFVVINLSVFVLGLISAAWVFLKHNHVSKFLLLFWMIFEFLNGAGHIIWTISALSYTPGIITACIMISIVLYLLKQIKHINGVSI